MNDQRPSSKGWSQLKPRRFSTRLILFTLMAGLIPILVFYVLLDLYGGRLVGKVKETVQKEQVLALRESEAILRDQARDAIRSKASDTARQVELYLAAHPGMTSARLRRSPNFREIGVQPVGKTGYTAVHEAEKRARNLLHKSPQVENTDLQDLAGTMPQFWEIVAEARDRKAAGGYYQWREADGAFREKYMYIAPVKVRTADGTRLAVAATTYTDEFLAPAQSVATISQRATHDILRYTDQLLGNFLLQGFSLLALTGILLMAWAIFTGRYLSRALTALSRATKEINRGNYAFRIASPMSGDIQDLAEDFNIMANCLETTTVSKERLEESEGRLRRLLDFIPEPTLAINRSGEVVYWNRAITEMTGTAREEVLGKGDRIYALYFYGVKRPLLIDYVFDPQLSRQDNYYNFRRDGDVISAEGYVPFPGKEGRFLWAKAGPIYDGVGKVIGAIETLRDITDERRLEEELRESEEHFRMVIQHSGAGIAVVDLRGKFILVNPALVELLGYSEEELLRMDFQQVSHPDDIAEEIEKAVRLLKGEIEGYRQEKRYIHKDGRILWALFTATLLRDRQGKPRYFIGQAQDITDRIRAEETIRQMAYHDPLTGLPNRKLLADRMQMAQARAKRQGHLVAVAYLDLDGFKEVNDVHGHEVGDLLLREAAGRIPGVLRKGDTMARVGGDEFVLIMPEIKDKSDVAAIAGKVMNCLRRPFLIGAHEIAITTSLGIAFYPDDGEDQEILLRNADDAMYQAKQAGKNTFRFYQIAMPCQTV